jgi:outer membrane protein assembly factor BamE (lipoprotein component of BamABCDE complex)
MKLHFAAAFTAAALAGCATYHQGRDWWTLTPDTFSGLTPGTTGKADVERLVGRPLLANAFPRQGEEVWDYRYLNGTRTYVAEIHFDGEGRTKYVASYPDRCSFRATPCR